MNDTDIDLSNSTLLIIDDDNKSLHAVSNILKSQQFDLRVYQGGTKVIEAVRKVEPDLILLDIPLLCEDGFAICKMLKEEPESKHIPVIFVAPERGESEHITRGFQSGGVDYITKPFYSEELLTRIRTHLQLQKYREYIENHRYYDPLTHTLSRHSMICKLHDENVRSKRSNLPFTILVGEVEQAIDRYSEDSLTRAGSILQRETREQDFISRWDTYEFLLLLPKTDRQGGEIAAEKLRCAIEDDPQPITMSFGVSTGLGENTYHAYIDQAYKALRHGKKNGGNCSVIYGKHCL